MTAEIPVEQFGAGKGGDDIAAIQAGVDACAPGGQYAGSTLLLSDAYVAKSPGPIVVGSSQSFRSTSNASLTAGLGAVDAVRIQNSGDFFTRLPKLLGFPGVSIDVCGCGEIEVKCHAVLNAGTALRLRTANGNKTLGNRIAIHSMRSCGVGVLCTSDGMTDVDGNGGTMQGNKFETNFFTGGSAVVWDAISRADGLPPVYPSWDANKWLFDSIDLVNTPGGVAFLNKSSNPVWRQKMVVDDWFGGAFADPATAGADPNVNPDLGGFIRGGFSGCTAEFSIAQVVGPYGLFQWRGAFNSVKLLGEFGGMLTGGGSGPFQFASGSQKAWSNGGFLIGFANCMDGHCSLPAAVPPGGQVTMYCYTPLLDGGSNTLLACPVTPIGLVLESIVDNSAACPNEVKITWRNAGASAIPAGTYFRAFVTCGIFP